MTIIPFSKRERNILNDCCSSFTYSRCSQENQVGLFFLQWSEKYRLCLSGWYLPVWATYQQIYTDAHKWSKQVNSLAGGCYCQNTLKDGRVILFHILLSVWCSILPTLPTCPHSPPLSLLRQPNSFWFLHSSQILSWVTTEAPHQSLFAFKLFQSILRNFGKIFTSICMYLSLNP